MNKKRYKIRGFTLVEVIIATALLVIIIAITFNVIITSQRTYSTGATISDLEEKGRLFIDRIKDELSEAKITSITNYHSRIQFQVPVDPDGNGSVINTVTKAIDWGAISPLPPPNNGHKLNWSYAYEFGATQTLNEATDGIDYNNDGTLNAIFVSGKIYHIVLDNLGVERQRTSIGHDVILRRSITTPAQVDLGIMSGLPPNPPTVLGDPLFIQLDPDGIEVPFSPVMVRVNIWHGKLDTSGNFTRFYLKNSNNTVALRNPQ